MAKKQQEIHEVESIPWEPIEGSPGVYQKILNEDPETGSVTRLIKHEPGTETKETQKHDFYEEIFILSGSSMDVKQNLMLKAGYYGYRHPGMEHGPWKSTEGQICFEVRDYKKEC